MGLQFWLLSRSLITASLERFWRSALSVQYLPHCVRGCRMKSATVSKPSAAEKKHSVAPFPFTGFFRCRFMSPRKRFEALRYLSAFGGKLTWIAAWPHKCPDHGLFRPPPLPRSAAGKPAESARRPFAPGVGRTTGQRAKRAYGPPTRGIRRAVLGRGA